MHAGPVREREASREPATGSPARVTTAPPAGAVSNHALARLLGRPGPFEAGDTAAAEQNAARASATEPPSGVRVHTGPLADRATAEAGTVAVTHGPDVVPSALVTRGPQAVRNRVLAHELQHAAEQAAADRPVLQGCGEASALISSMTAQTTAAMDDTTAQSELYEASRALSDPDLPPAERATLRTNRDLLESEVRRRSLATAVPGTGTEEYATAGIVLSDDPEHARHALELLVAAQGTAAAGRVVEDVRYLSTDGGRALATMAGEVGRPLRLAEPTAFPSPAKHHRVTEASNHLPACRRS